PPPPPRCDTPCGCPRGLGCTRTWDFWADTPEQWPADGLRIAGAWYDQGDLIDILRGRVSDDTSLVLARALITARLNQAAGASGGRLAVEGAELWMDRWADQDGRLPFGITGDDRAHWTAVGLTAALGAYNEGFAGPGRCAW